MTIDHLISSLLFLVALAGSIGITRADEPAATAPAGSFSSALATQLHDQPGNLIYSPLSIRTAMQMAAAGALGETRKQMDAVLGASDGDQPTPKDSTVKLANGLWVQEGLALKPDYQTAIQNQFHGDVASVDFKKDPKAICDQINHWVSDRTAGKIDKLFSPDSLRPSERLILVNAIYLKANWQTPFDPSATHDAPFKIDGSAKTAPVPMMHANMHMQYAEDDDAQTISLPYVSDDLAMVIILPRRDDGLAAVESKHAAIDQMSFREVELSLPRWKSATTIHLVPILKKMGITKAFGASANFGGICDEPVLIGDVVHQATIDVDETGTEAAAATGVQMRAMAMRPQPPVVVNVDHPFLFKIVQRTSGTVLFAGRVTDPRG